MERWLATSEELGVDLLFLQAAKAVLAPVPCDHRIAFQDGDQVRVIIPDPNMIAALMHGGIIRHVRVVGADDEETRAAGLLPGEPIDEVPRGRPIYEGSGDRMAAMSYADAVGFVLWKDLPQGINRFEVMTTADLPHIHGDAQKARRFRAAWRLEEEA